MTEQEEEKRKHRSALRALNKFFHYLAPISKRNHSFCSLKKPFQANRHAAFKEIKSEVVVTIAKKSKHREC